MGVGEGWVGSSRSVAVSFAVRCWDVWCLEKLTEAGMRRLGGGEYARIQPFFLDHLIALAAGKVGVLINVFQLR